MNANSEFNFRYTTPIGLNNTRYYGNEDNPGITNFVSNIHHGPTIKGHGDLDGLNRRLNMRNDNPARNGINRHLQGVQKRNTHHVANHQKQQLKTLKNRLGYQANTAATIDSEKYAQSVESDVSRRISKEILRVSIQFSCPTLTQLKIYHIFLTPAAVHPI